MTNRLYRPAVGIMLQNCEGKIFVGERFDATKAWQMPQGGIDKNEPIEMAAKRELFEETNVTSAKIIAQSSQWFHYDLPKNVAKKLWNGRYVGQKQKWFLMQFTGDNSEINISKNHKEFANWQWVEPSQLVELIVDFKKDLYENVIKEFQQYIF